MTTFDRHVAFTRQDRQPAANISVDKVKLTEAYLETRQPSASPVAPEPALRHCRRCQSIAERRTCRPADGADAGLQGALGACIPHPLSLSPRPRRDPTSPEIVVCSIHVTYLHPENPLVRYLPLVLPRCRNSFSFPPSGPVRLVHLPRLASLKRARSLAPSSP